MKGSAHKIAQIFAEAGYLERNRFGKIIGASAKSLGEILWSKQPARAFRDLMTYEIPLPFAKGKRERIQAELRRDLSISPDEVREFFLQFPERAAEVTRILEDAGLMWPGTTDQVLEGVGARGADYIDDMFREMVITTEPLATYLERENPTSLAVRWRQSESLMVFNRLLKKDRVSELRAQRDRSAAPLPEILEQVGGVTQDALEEALAGGLYLPKADIAAPLLPADAPTFLPPEMMHRHLILPSEIGDEGVGLAMADPLDTALVDAIEILTGRAIIPLFASQRDLIARLRAAVPHGSPDESQFPMRPGAEEPLPPPEADPFAEAGDDETLVDNVSTVELVLTIIESAFATRATDIHVEPMQEEVRVRYRIDGRLKTIMQVPPEMLLPIVARIKVLSDLNVTERRRPQDGHFGLDLGDDTVDLRVSVVPTHIGEKVVIRVLDEANVIRGLGDLGMPDPENDRIRHLIERPHGMLLVVGPTGSGKTTTLYSCLNTLNIEDVNIVTIEDPVEYRIDGINQIQVDAKIDLSFAAGLRSTLRQDPDVIMVGEIRDQETAHIATRSALTGHFVLSTLHSNSSAGTVSTLRHMNIPAFSVANSLAGIVSQRLLRRLCVKCREAFTPRKQLKIDLGLPESSRKQAHRAVGCDACLDTGYSGRTGLFEVWEISQAMREVILNDGSERELVQAAEEGAMRSLLDNAHDLIHAGITSPEEVLRVVRLD